MAVALAASVVAIWAVMAPGAGADGAALVRARYLSAADATCLRYERRRPAGTPPQDRAGAFRRLAALAAADHRFLVEWADLHPPAELRGGHSRLRAVAAEWAVTLDAVWAGLERDGDTAAAMDALDEARGSMAARFADTARGMGLHACAGEFDGPESSDV